MGAGKRAPLVAEQRALHQVSRHRRQVDGDERRFGIARLAVNVARQQFLAGSALAKDQDGCRQLRDLVDEIDDVARDLARPDDKLTLGLVGHLRRQRQHLTVEVLALARIAHQRAQLVVVEILVDVVIGAVLHRLHGGLDVGDRGDHQHFDQAVVLLDDAQHFEAADAGQPHVEEHEVDVFAVEQR